MFSLAPIFQFAAAMQDEELAELKTCPKRWPSEGKDQVTLVVMPENRSHQDSARRPRGRAATAGQRRQGIDRGQRLRSVRLV